MAALTLSSIPVVFLQQAMAAFKRGPLRDLRHELRSPRGHFHECHVRVSAIFDKILADAGRVFASHSTSRDKRIRDRVAVLKGELGTLQQRVKEILAVRRISSATPVEARVSEMFRSAREHSLGVSVYCPSEEYPAPSVFDVLALEYKADFVFEGITYPSVLAAFEAKVTPRDPSVRYETMSQGDIMREHGKALEREAVMKAILRAKFGSGEAQIYLMATLETYLWVAMPEPCRHPLDPRDTSNRLGDLLMSVRAECKWKKVT